MGITAYILVDDFVLEAPAAEFREDEIREVIVNGEDSILSKRRFPSLPTSR